MNELNTIHLDLPVTNRYLNVVSAALSAILERVEGVTVSSTLVYSVQLAVDEICTNIVEHAYEASGGQGRIWIGFTFFPQGQSLVVDIEDTGRPFDPDGVPLPNLEEGQIRGYGLFLTQALMDRVEYCRVNNKNCWQLTKNLTE